MQMPAGVSISIIKDVTSAQMSFDMIDADTNKVVANVNAKSQVKYSNGALVASFAPTDVTVKDSGGFSNLLKELMLTKSKDVLLAGTASPHAITNMGEMQFEDVPFSGKTTLVGFNSFQDGSGKPLMKVTGLDVTGGSSGSLDLSIDVEVTNPSIVQLRLVKSLWICGL